MALIRGHMVHLNMTHDISWITAVYHSRMGIAQSQVLLGNWSAEFAAEKEDKYRVEYLAGLSRVYQQNVVND